MKKINYIVVLVLVTIIAIIFLLKPINYSVIPPLNQAPTLTPTPTPMPFAEMTIPYLRNRSYTSTLLERKLFSTQSSYSSYLTSYMSDGLKINALLTVPATEKPLQGFPAIVFVHGYIPPTQYSTTSNYAAFVDSFARNGFVVLKIDLRGHGTSEGEASGAYYSSDYVIDTLNAVAALQEFDEVNPNYIGLWGHSMAGNIVARSLSIMPSVKAGVIWAGAVYTYIDFQEYGIQDSSYQPPQFQSERIRRREQLFTTHGRPSATSEFWKQVAPSTYLPEYQGALQIHHSVDDSVVSIEFSRNLKQLLANTPVQLEVFEYSTGGHNLQGNTFNQAMERSIDFFKLKLQ